MKGQEVDESPANTIMRSKREKHALSCLVKNLRTDLDTQTHTLPHVHTTTGKEKRGKCLTFKSIVHDKIYHSTDKTKVVLFKSRDRSRANINNTKERKGRGERDRIYEKKNKKNHSQLKQQKAHLILLHSTLFLFCFIDCERCSFIVRGKIYDSRNVKKGFERRKQYAGEEHKKRSSVWNKTIKTTEK